MDLVYIDPPFATGADFSYDVKVGDLTLEKLPGSIEELAYRDTWQEGLGSYCQMMWERLRLTYDLISPKGSMYLHCDPTASHYLKAMMDEIWGRDNFRNELVWKRTTGRSDGNRYGRVHDVIFFYGQGTDITWNDVFEPLDPEYVQKFYRHNDERSEKFGPVRSDNLTGPGVTSGESGAPWRGAAPTNAGRTWSVPRRGDYAEWIDENIIPGYKDIESVHARLEALDAHDMLIWPKNGTMPSLKRYLSSSRGERANDTITNILPVQPNAKERTGYQTQKPDALLERILKASSNPGDLVLDFFAGSGTTLAVAENLGRRWIAADLGRYAIHTARKRLLDIPGCRPFEVQNLGRYERRRWQGANAGEAIGEYYRLILDLYEANSVPGFAHLHGEKAGRMVHVGATDAPVTNTELRAAIEECVENGFVSLDVLGWEWEMGLNRRAGDPSYGSAPAGRDELAAHYGVDTHLVNIPQEVMDERAVKAGDVHFFELSVAEVAAHVDGREATLELTGFLPALDDDMRKKTEGKIARWSDWIDYWSVDYEYDGETFVNQWQAYRTRREPRLALRSDPHRYAPGTTHRAVAKVIDIFGNDTTCEIAVTVE